MDFDDDRGRPGRSARSSTRYDCPQSAAAELRTWLSLTLAELREGWITPVEAIDAVGCLCDRVLSCDLGVPVVGDAYFFAQLPVLEARLCALEQIAAEADDPRIPAYVGVVAELTPLVWAQGPELCPDDVPPRVLELALQLHELGRELGIDVD